MVTNSSHFCHYIVCVDRKSLCEVNYVENAKSDHAIKAYLWFCSSEGRPGRPQAPALPGKPQAGGPTRPGIPPMEMGLDDTGVSGHPIFQLITKFNELLLYIYYHRAFQKLQRALILHKLFPQRLFPHNTQYFGAKYQ